MQQEDDLRALAKIMDFLRALSIVLVVMNVYWYCYEAILSWLSLRHIYDTSISHRLSPAGRRSGFANTTIDIRTANCSPASLRRWRSAVASGTSGCNVKRIRR